MSDLLPNRLLQGQWLDDAWGDVALSDGSACTGGTQATIACEGSLVSPPVNDSWEWRGPTFSAKPVHIAAPNAKTKRAPLQEGQDPSDHVPVLRLVGVLLRILLGTRPDISWAVARIA